MVLFHLFFIILNFIFLNLSLFFGLFYVVIFSSKHVLHYIFTEDEPHVPKFKINGI